MEVLDIYSKGQLTAKDVRAQINLIQEVMQSVMIEGTHYGTIPGCKKPSLYKPGAEKILSTFGLKADPDIEDLCTDDEIRYRIKSCIISAGGRVIGYGVGECSSKEEKYKWRGSVCDEEFNETPEDLRRQKWCKGWNNKPNYQIKQVRTNMSDIANTILKMAKKRSLVDACLTTTACSDIFEQDIEDLDGVVDINRKNGQEPIGTPQGKKKKTAKKEKPLLKVTTTIDKVSAHETKSGSSLYKVLGEKDIIYSTFSESLATLARSAMEGGCQIEMTHKNDTYNTIEDIKILEGEHADKTDPA